MTCKSSKRHTFKALLLTMLLLTALTTLHSRTYHVCQEGSGDYLTISIAIFAAQDGDTLIVHPGIYYENINFEGKNIVLTSLYGIESYDRRYIRETIIDGNRLDTVVTFDSGETRAAVLSGFTIRNGEGRYAGGINIIRTSSPVIRYNIIEFNYTTCITGGVSVENGRPLLRGNTIRHNVGWWTGGFSVYRGVDDQHTEFCPVELNSIYLNHGSQFCDIRIGTPIWGDSKESIIIDTLSVATPDLFFVGKSTRNLPAGYSVTINHGIIEPIAADLYVAADGCDTNSGLTPEEPLQRIAAALMRIKPDSEIRRTVYVAEGIYSSSLNEQWFPIGVRENIDIVGHHRDTTILHGDDKYLLIESVSYPDFPHDRSRNFTVKNFTLTNGCQGGSPSFGVINCLNAEDFTLENLIVANTSSNILENERSSHRVISFQRCNNVTLKNIEIRHNDITADNDRLFSVVGREFSIYAENIRFRNNHSKGLGRIYVKGVLQEPQPYHVTFVNLELTDTISHVQYPTQSYSTYILIDAKARFINATISNNYTADTFGNLRVIGAILLCDRELLTNVSLHNSILYNNHGNCQIFFIRGRHWVGGPDVLTVSHSLIENGIDGVRDVYGGNIINWQNGNIDADPLFVGEDVNPDYPYMLSENSPARGAGTLDIHDFEFPEYDLAGNPRIVDGKIDMGAYQWHPQTEVRESDKETERLREGEFNLRNFPNPAVTLLNHSSAGVEGHRSSTTGTNIAFETPEVGNVIIEIYNLKGQFVKRLFDADVSPGDYNVFWDGKDERGRYVATGFYMYHLKFNDQLVATGRATFIK